jgi:hypothetical protein
MQAPYDAYYAPLGALVASARHDHENLNLNPHHAIVEGERA